MNGSQTYEKIVKIKNSGKRLVFRICSIAAYGIFFAVWLFAAFLNPTRFIAVIAAGVLCTLLLILITYKYLNAEYEYALWYGNLEISKIYSGKKRKSLLAADVKEMLMIAPMTEEFLNKAEYFELDGKIDATSEKNAENKWLLVTGGKDEPRILVIFEADERLLAMLKSANPSVFTKRYN